MTWSEALKRPSITEDSEVNVYEPPDFSAIDLFTDDYLDAVACPDLAWWRFCVDDPAASDRPAHGRSECAQARPGKP
jgi:hypothetical protein